MSYRRLDASLEWIVSYQLWECCPSHQNKTQCHLLKAKADIICCKLNQHRLVVAGTVKIVCDAIWLYWWALWLYVSKSSIDNSELISVYLPNDKRPNLSRQRRWSIDYRLKSPYNVCAQIVTS